MAVFLLPCITSIAQTLPYLQPKLSLSTSVPKIRPKKPVLLSIVADSLAKDSLTLSMNEDLKSEVQYNSKDSSITDVDGKVLHLYGDAKVVYGQITLTADYIRVNWDKNEIFARGTMDSTKHRLMGRPVFEDAGEKYDSDEIRYNFKTKKGVIRQIITQQGDGNVRGSTVKKDEEDNLYIRGSMYTTCNMPEPHFHIASRKIKLVKDKQVISGPFNLVLEGIPTPLGLPFGFFPIPKKKEIGTSGIIMPSYGEEPNGRGFFLRSGGYYFAISDKVNLTLTADIYSKGSWGIGAVVPYNVRYRYSGNLNFSYGLFKTGDEVEKRNIGSAQYNLTWSHSPVTRGRTSFSASVNYGSNSFNQLNAYDTRSITKNQSNSSIQFGHRFGQAINFSSSIRINQEFPQNRNLLDSLTNFPKDPGKTEGGLDFSLSLPQISPFALKGGTGKWYESFRVSAETRGVFSVTNERQAYIDTATLGFRANLVGNLAQVKQLKKGEYLTMPVFDSLGVIFKNYGFSGSFSVPIGLPIIKLTNYLTLTPNISLSGQIYEKQYRYKYNEAIDRVEVEEVRGSVFVPEYSFGMGLNTRIFGTVFVRKGRLEAIRHTMIPSISYSFVPDRTTNAYQAAQASKDVNDIRYFNRFRSIGVVQGNLSSSFSSNASWSINNMFEAKVRPKSDSTGKQFEKKNLMNLNISGGYDFTLPMFKFSNVSLNANSQLTKNINFNFSSTLDPYSYVEDKTYGAVGRKIDEWTFTNKQGLAQLSNMSIGFDARFAPKAANKPKKSKEATEEQLKEINQNLDRYVDFNIPWTFSIGYSYGYSKQGLAPKTVTNAVQIRGDFSLTPKWKFVYTTGYDIEMKAPSITNLQINRDLHCWEMAFNWTPFSASKFMSGSYTFDLRVKSSILKDLKLSRNRSFGGRGYY